MSPVNRAVYLAWLTGGRRRAGIQIGYVFVFFYGLERRVLLDIQHDTSLESELPAIRTEVSALLDRYGEPSNSFTEYANTLLGIIDVLIARGSDAPLPPPQLRPDRFAIPESLRLELGRRALNGTPISADLALAWAWYLPDVTPRTPAVRCPEEFARLFAVRFGQAFPNGLVLRPTGKGAGAELLLGERRPAVNCCAIT